MRYLQVSLISRDPTGNLFVFDSPNSVTDADIQRFIKKLDFEFHSDGVTTVKADLLNGRKITERFASIGPGHEVAMTEGAKLLNKRIWRYLNFIRHCALLDNREPLPDKRYLLVELKREPTLAAIPLENGVFITETDVKKFIIATSIDRVENGLRAMAFLRNGCVITRSRALVYDYDGQVTHLAQMIDAEVFDRLSFLLRIAIVARMDNHDVS